ncbi:conserved hypothetical protein [Methylocella silvestris BL2]|uniref:DUF2252 domain-containing protein n=1 Tax=Methylocella silvestris (strain DSM 15510 / CIP 108128 / LMG 27833 / NCIMB 13906 / BL2) TaxID=395965 RepID=B8EQA7_METSB|nr:DUF2252 family protein [Methylocella silvestris]ACK51597.1 conserved hypothetical protein [Methylocella silvestris BL2]
MSFVDENTAFEEWLRSQCHVVEADLDYKHVRMKKDAFTFLRATFFRWAQRIETICPTLREAPAAPSVGDAHTENFGTWRDGDGRLVWGVNDFDEAAVIAYPFDLVRLATSVRLAPGAALDNHAAAKAILDGYGEGLDRPGPMLLDENATLMRPFVEGAEDSPRKFWDEVASYPAAEPPGEVQDVLRLSLPADAVVERFASRRKGGGGLGRPRFVAAARWRGGGVVREAKALVPSAWNWAHGRGGSAPSFSDLATGKYRSPDPFLRDVGKFIVRRIAADSRKIELGETAGAELSLRLLSAMAMDLASIHAVNNSDRQAIREHLVAQPPDWLHDAAAAAAVDVKKDFDEWRR